MAAAERDDAEGAAVVAAVLDRHERAGMPAHAGDARRLGPAHRHDVLRCGHGTVAPALRSQLRRVADEARHLRHLGIVRALDLGAAAGHDDLGVGPLAGKAADRLAGLTTGLGGDGAGIDHDEVAALRPGLGMAAHHLRLDGVEPAAEGERLDAHPSSPANRSAAKVPSPSR